MRWRARRRCSGDSDPEGERTEAGGVLKGSVLKSTVSAPGGGDTMPVGRRRCWRWWAGMAGGEDGGEWRPEDSGCSSVCRRRASYCCRSSAWEGVGGRSIDSIRSRRVWSPLTGAVCPTCELKRVAVQKGLLTPRAALLGKVMRETVALLSSRGSVTYSRVESTVSISACNVELCAEHTPTARTQTKLQSGEGCLMVKGRRWRRTAAVSHPE